MHIPQIGEGPNEYLEVTPATENISGYSENSEEETNSDIFSLVFLQENTSVSELLIPDPCVMPNKNNACDNGNVSRFVPNNSDTQNILFVSSEGERTSLSDNLESSIREDDPDVILNKIKAKNVDRLIIAHININFLERKFEPLVSLVKDKMDIFLISETKLDDTFPLHQFMIDGYSEPIRLDRNCYGGGLIFFIRDDLPCKVLPHSLPKDVEGIFIELTLRKTKWLLMWGYNPQKNIISYFLSHVSKQLDKFLPTYENLLLLGDFNSHVHDNEMKSFCDMYNLKNLINEPTCYKNVVNPSSIDVMLTNKKGSFQNSLVVETGLSDHHKMTISVLKKYVKKKAPITINYRNYKKFNETDFRNDLIWKLDNLYDEIINYDYFKSIFMKVLDKHAPSNNFLSKAFMHRSKLKNRLNKDPSDINRRLYKKQRNHCVNLLKKEKKKYYNNLNMNIFEDNQKFWQTIKSLFSDKSNGPRKNIIILENGIVTSDKKEAAEKLNTYFIESVRKLDIESFVPEDITDINFDNSMDVIDIIIMKYRSHPSILKIKDNVIISNIFEFKNVTSDEIEKEIKQLNPKKACVENDIPTKVLVSINDIVSLHLSNIYNTSKNDQTYPLSLKFADVTPIHKAKEKILLKN